MEGRCRERILQITAMVVLLMVQKVSANAVNVTLELEDGGSKDVEICEGGHTFLKVKATANAPQKITLFGFLIFYDTGKITNHTVEVVEPTESNPSQGIYKLNLNVTEKVLYIACGYSTVFPPTEQVPCKDIISLTVKTIKCTTTRPVTRGRPGGLTTKVHKTGDLTTNVPKIGGSTPTVPKTAGSTTPHRRSTTKGKVTESASTITATVSVKFQQAIKTGGETLRQQLIGSFPDLKEKLEALDTKQLTALQEKLLPLKEADHQAIRAATVKFLESQQQLTIEVIIGGIAGIVVLLAVVVAVSCYSCKCCCWKKKTNPEDPPPDAPSGSADLKTSKSMDLKTSKFPIKCCCWKEKRTQKKTTPEDPTSGAPSGSTDLKASESTDLKTSKSPKTKPAAPSGRRTSRSSVVSKSSAASNSSKAGSGSTESSVDRRSNDSAGTGSVASSDRKSDDRSDVSGSVQSADSKSTDSSSGSSGETVDGSVRLVYSTTTNVVSLKKNKV